MPPASKAAAASSKLKATSNDLSTSPDNDSPPEPAFQPRPTKKKKHAAKQQSQSATPPEELLNGETTTEEPSSVRKEKVHGIPRAFPTPRTRSPPPDDLDDLPATEKVSNQHTPPNDDEKWLDDALCGTAPAVGPIPSHNVRATPAAQPGFSTRGGFSSKTPPISPPQRHARPVSYGGSIPPLPHHPRMSTSPYSQPPSAYGSPPAPHMAQPHFYHAHDIDLGLPRSTAQQYNEEPTLVKHTRLHSKEGDPRQGVILGFEGRLSIVSIDQGKVEELGGIGGFSGTVVDAVLLQHGLEPDVPDGANPLVAVVIHGPVEPGSLPSEINHVNGLAHPPLNAPSLGYATRVDVFSLQDGMRVASLLQTPSVSSQPVGRGVSPSPPDPVGHLKLYNSSDYLVVASGTSGEVFVFGLNGSPLEFECIGKFWTSIQPMILRRDSSHHRLSDADVSPADIGRGTKTSERAIVDLKGRWLAICPASLPSPPSIGAAIGPAVAIRRSNGLETTSAPVRPSVTCEVDSPDVDTLFGKVARGVAQELVKGAKWLGDQGLQTWQNYWGKGQSPPTVPSQQPYSPPVYATQQMPNMFPPTHADVSRKPKDLDIVSIFDLRVLQEAYTQHTTEDMRPIATFQPPSGCSYVSFSPHGLNLLTSGQKGYVQYIWDLMQLKNCRSSVTISDDEHLKAQPRVRQIARFERLSASMIVDVVWDGLTGTRVAILTRNNTIHLFDLPQSAFRWPPPRTARKLRSTPAKATDILSGANQQDIPATNSFLASAMNIANRAQPMVSGWRGRAPSMGGGLAGIGTTSMGLASATGVRGGKVVAASLSKSLGAASETVSNIRHANDNKIHLTAAQVFTSGKIFWSRKRQNSVLCVIDSGVVKLYHVRKSKAQEKPQKESISVFEAKKAIPMILPKSLDLKSGLPELEGGPTDEAYFGFWKTRPGPSLKSSLHPLAFAEIDTNAPYQPFHTDRRVTLASYADHEQDGDGRREPSLSSGRRREHKTSGAGSQWVFGDDIPVVQISLKKGPFFDEADSNSVIYRETTITSPTIGDNDIEQIVSTTRRSSKKKSGVLQHDTASDIQKDDFEFEDDCEVLDFATDRV